MDFKRLIKYLPLVPVSLLFGASVFFSHSCANTTTPPSGGDKDTIPPVIVGLSPLPGTVNVPVHNTKILITFNEYVTVKDPKSIFLSPPQAKQPRYKMKNKTLVVYFEEDLEENTTYTLDLTNAIADNNEGNMYPGYTLVFSTGSQIDSMAMTGSVLDCNTLQPVKGATVLLYKDLSDSAVIKHRPDAAVKTDAWGFFSLRNIADTTYRLYALLEETPNNVYDLDNDNIAFIDSIIRPKMVVREDLPELLKYDMEDTLKCMARRSEHELLLFKERPSKQLIVNKERTGDRSAYLTFMAPEAKIDSIWVRNVRNGHLIAQFNPRRDSLEFWINERKKMPDTLHVFVDYMKTDTNGVLVPFTEHLRLPLAKTGKGASKSSRRDLKHEDTICVMTVKAEPETVEQIGYSFEFKYPVIYEHFDSLQLTSVNPRQQRSPMKFKVTRDSLNLRNYHLMPEGRLQSGFDYILKVPQRMFRDINGFWNDSTEVKVALPKDDKLSSLTLYVSNVHHRYIVDLLNEKRDKVLRSYTIENDQVLAFPYLKEGKYSVRLTEDVNRNGIVDTGNLLGHRQPEKVKFFKLRDGSYVIDIKENTELEQHLDAGAMFAEQ